LWRNHSGFILIKGELTIPEATLTPTESAKKLDFRALITRHRNYFLSGVTRSVEWREEQLMALRSMMKEHAEDFYAALWTDLRRNRIEADWMKPLPVSTPLVLAPSHGQVRY
jgi:acyl-CoA reductase-like NAD-dependent aldehyde dehydrogenase